MGNSWADPTNYEFEYEDTAHPCPECGQGLRRVHPSTMLVCSNKDQEHGPYFLV